MLQTHLRPHVSDADYPRRAYLSLLHPRLLQSLVLIEPMIQKQNPGIEYAVLSSKRRDTWPSRTAAAESFRRRRHYQAWDARVLDLWIQHGLRDVPSSTEEGASEQRETPVTLATSIPQEVFLYERPTYNGQPGVPVEDDKHNYADFDPSIPKDYPDHPFYRAETAFLYDQLPAIRPKTSYIFGERSDAGRTRNFEPSDGWASKVKRTGMGVGGGGGIATGQVERTVMAEASHLLPFEKVEETAKLISGFILPDLEQWRMRDQAFRKKWVARPQDEKSSLDEKWMHAVDPRSSDTKR